MGNDMKKSIRFRWSVCSGKGWSICVGNRWSICSETGGQFKLKSGGQFHRFFHHNHQNSNLLFGMGGIAMSAMMLIMLL